MEDDDQQKTLDLVKELVHRLLSHNPTAPNNDSQNPNPIDLNNSFRYAVRILTPSIAPDADAIAESIKRRLATQGKSSKALSFADLYNKFASKTGAGSINNKWAVLYLLKIVSEDRKVSLASQNSALLLSNLTLDDREIGGDSRKLRRGDKGWENGVLVVAKDPENLREIVFREFVNLVKEENEVSEEVPVRDLLYACQGIDGKYVKFDADLDG